MSEYNLHDEPECFCEECQDSLFAHEQCKRMRTLVLDKEVFYLIKTSDTAITNEEHFKHDVEQIVRSFCGILSRKEIETFFVDVLKGVYGR